MSSQTGQHKTTNTKHGHKAYTVNKSLKVTNKAQLPNKKWLKMKRSSNVWIVCYLKIYHINPQNLPKISTPNLLKFRNETLK